MSTPEISRRRLLAIVLACTALAVAAGASFIAARVDEPERPSMHPAASVTASDVGEAFALGMRVVVARTPASAVEGVVTAIDDTHVIVDTGAAVPVRGMRSRVVPTSRHATSAKPKDVLLCPIGKGIWQGCLVETVSEQTLHVVTVSGRSTQIELGDALVPATVLAQEIAEYSATHERLRAMHRSSEERPPQGDTLEAKFGATPPEVVDAMLALAEVSANDVVYDLGSGDGRILIAAAQKYGAKGVGFEVDPQLVALSRRNAERAGVEDLVSVERRDLFEADLSRATVVTLFLGADLNARLLPQLSKLPTGARVVSHFFPIPGVDSDDTITVLVGAPDAAAPPPDAAAPPPDVHPSQVVSGGTPAGYRVKVHLWRAPLATPTSPP